MRFSLLFVLLVVSLTANAITLDEADTDEERQLVLSLTSEVFDNTRKLRVLLPPGYYDSENAEKRYPVFYFTDGIAAWHGWGLQEVAETLWQQEKIPSIIFVAIDNGGSTDKTSNPVRDRASEYLPYNDQSWVENPPEPKGKLFPTFLFDEVVPLIDASFRTNGSQKIGLAGSSYGAVVSLYTAMKHPDRISWLLLESPSLRIGSGRMVEDARLHKEWPRRIYIGVGTTEGETLEAQQEMTRNAQLLSKAIKARQKGMRGTFPEEGKASQAFTAINMIFHMQQGGTHWYDAWKERLPKALVSVLAPENVSALGDGS